VLSNSLKHILTVEAPMAMLPVRSPLQEHMAFQVGGRFLEGGKARSMGRVEGLWQPQQVCRGRAAGVRDCWAVTWTHQNRTHKHAQACQAQQLPVIVNRAEHYAFLRFRPFVSAHNNQHCRSGYVQDCVALSPPLLAGSLRWSSWWLVGHTQV
jgi:hypothetical protein